MAKQDFVSGGFYGKLGALVGQRWGNRRTIRTYVVPTDPKTEKQLAWRKKFGQGIAACHVANAMDWNSPIFESGGESKQNQRQRATLAFAAAGYTGIGLIPLTPYGTSAPNVITGFSVLTDSDGQTWGILEGAEPTTEVGFAIAVGSVTEAPNLDNVSIFYATWDVDNAALPLSEAAAALIVEGANIRICSNSQTTTEDDYFCSDTLTVAAYEIQEVDLTILDMALATSDDTLTFYIPGYTGKLQSVEITGKAQFTTPFGNITVAVENPVATSYEGCPAFTIDRIYTDLSEPFLPVPAIRPLNVSSLTAQTLKYAFTGQTPYPLAIDGAVIETPVVFTAQTLSLPIDINTVDYENLQLAIVENPYSETLSSSYNSVTLDAVSNATLVLSSTLGLTTPLTLNVKYTDGASNPLFLSPEFYNMSLYVPPMLESGSYIAAQSVTIKVNLCTYTLTIPKIELYFENPNAYVAMVPSLASHLPDNAGRSDYSTVVTVDSDGLATLTIKTSWFASDDAPITPAESPTLASYATFSISEGDVSVNLTPTSSTTVSIAKSDVDTDFYNIVVTNLEGASEDMTFTAPELGTPVEFSDAIMQNTGINTLM